tara:strand:+ start:2637 stop:3629 length:993 start_codon:yes stop_codon:yes gene_type:complete
MLIHCKFCNSKFAINAEEQGFDGRLVKCENCQKEWFQESKAQILEKKLIELDRSLHSTELHLIEKKNNHNNKIRKLEKALKIKKDELVKQKLLENRINLFEKRIAETEKEIESQSLIENRIAKLEKDIRQNTFDSFVKNTKLEKKTNELQSKVGSDDIVNKLNVLENLEKEVKDRTDEITNKNIDLEIKASQLEKRLQGYNAIDKLSELEKDFAKTKKDHKIIDNGKSNDNGKTGKHTFFSPMKEEAINLEVNKDQEKQKKQNKFSFWAKTDAEEADTGELVKEYFRKKKDISSDKKINVNNIYKAKNWDLSQETIERELDQIKTGKNKS